MKKADLFFGIFLGMIVFIRVFLWFYTVHSPEVFGLQMHHYMYGLVLIPLGYWMRNIPLFAIGMALFVDELGFVLIGGESHDDNYSILSLSLLVVFVILTFVWRERIVAWSKNG